MIESVSHLSPQARLWIWVSSRPIMTEEAHDLKTALDSFLKTWSSHERPIRGAWKLVDDRILLIAGEIPGGDISGCGIDKSVHQIEKVAVNHGFEWLPGLDVVFRRSPEAPLESLPRPVFRDAISSGQIGPNAIVVDRTIGTIEDLLAGQLERPARDSWARPFLSATQQKAQL